MTVWPLKFRNISRDAVVVADDAGRWFRTDDAFIHRYGSDTLTQKDYQFLERNGHAFENEGDIAYLGYAWTWSSRIAAPKTLAYIILVPTLRCNLSCDYCQVSRAAESAIGYDWTHDTTQSVLAYLDALETDHCKIEFQGGEPLLRVDLLEEVYNFCRKRFLNPEFVVCTNLQDVGDKEWAFLAKEGISVSTSVDGDPATHNLRRNQDESSTAQFFANLQNALERLGSSKLSALPTIDPFDPPDFESLTATYETLGISSIYLRPINYQGFARRRRATLGEATATWTRLHSEFLEFLIQRNYRTGYYQEEYYFTHCLRRILAPGYDQHVDLRNPNWLAKDYIVIDYDGELYPSDEARMLARVGHVDLSIGNVTRGVDIDKIELLNANSFNNFDPDCIHCVYQPFCGTDTIDDISRYRRIDVPRHSTWFCQRHLALFDKAFELIYRGDEPTKRSLARWAGVGSSRVDLQACKLEYSIVSPK